MVEVVQVVKYLKNRKPCGPHGVPNELLKHAEKIDVVLAYVFKQLYRVDVITEWTKAHISKKDAENCAKTTENEIDINYMRKVHEEYTKWGLDCN